MPEIRPDALVPGARAYLEGAAKTLADVAATEVDRLAAVSALLAQRLPRAARCSPAGTAARPPTRSTSRPSSPASSTCTAPACRPSH